MKTIPLSGGKYHAIVDDEDYPNLSRFSWHIEHGSSGKLYARRSTGGKQIKMHRAIVGALPRQMVDHRDGNGLNNVRSNLRVCDNSQNQANTEGRGGSSRFKGVYFCRRTRRWKAAIMHRRRYYCLGSYRTEIEAAQAANEGYRWLKGAFARLNDVPPRQYNLDPADAELTSRQAVAVAESVAENPVKLA